MKAAQHAVSRWVHRWQCARKRSPSCSSGKRCSMAASGVCLTAQQSAHLAILAWHKRCGKDTGAAEAPDERVDAPSASDVEAPLRDVKVVVSKMYAPSYRYRRAHRHAAGVGGAAAGAAPAAGAESSAVALPRLLLAAAPSPVGAAPTIAAALAAGDVLGSRKAPPPPPTPTLAECSFAMLGLLDPLPPPLPDTAAAVPAARAVVGCDVRRVRWPVGDAAGSASPSCAT